jgi:hypothetical protein
VLIARRPTLADLARVQERRAWPTRATQSAQMTVQKRIVGRALAASEALPTPLPFRVISKIHGLQGVVARMVGMGVRPELPE